MNKRLMRVCALLMSFSLLFNGSISYAASIPLESVTDSQINTVENENSLEKNYEIADSEPGFEIESDDSGKTEDVNQQNENETEDSNNEVNESEFAVDKEDIAEDDDENIALLSLTDEVNSGLLYQDNFNNGLTEWIQWRNDTSADLIIEEGEGSDGSKCVRFDCQHIARGTLSKKIAISNILELYINQKIYCDISAGGLQIRCSFKDTDGNSIGEQITKNLATASCDWKEQNCRINVPTGTEQVVFEYVYSSANGVICIDDLEIYDGSKVENEEFQASDEAVSYSQMQHPRIALSAERISELNSAVEEDTQLGAIYDILIRALERNLSMDCIPYNLSGGLDTASAEIIMECALGYQMTNNSNYAERGIKELLNVCNYPDWDAENNFVQVSKLLYGVALGYDWLYDYMNEEQRQIVNTAVQNYAFKTAKNAYLNYDYFTSMTNNYNIASNTAIILIAAAIMDTENVNDVAWYLDSAANNLNNVLPEYFKDGSCNEGVTYWELAMTGTALAEYVLPSFGYEMNLNYDKMGEFLFATTDSNLQSYNFSDADLNPIASYFGALMAQKTGNSTYQSYSDILHNASPRADVYDFIFYSGLNGSEEIDLESMLEFPSSGVYSMCSSYSDKNALYVAMKGGASCATSHGDKDIGSFVLNADGVRWFEELSKGDYSEGYFDVSENGERWKYLCKNAFGHNTIIVDGEDQLRVFENIPVTTEQNSVIMDLSAAYNNDKTKSIKRTFTLENEEIFTINDEYTFNGAQDITWSFYTYADVNIVGDQVVLTRDDKSLTMKFTSEDILKITVGPVDNYDGLNVIQVAAKSASGELNTQIIRGNVLEDTLSIAQVQISPDNIQTINKEVRIVVTAENGNGSYQYGCTAVRDDGYSVPIASNDNSNEFTWIPDKAGTYDVCVEVTDGKIVTSKKIKGYVVQPEKDYLTAEFQSGQIAGTSVKFSCNDPDAVQVRYSRISNGNVTIFRDYSTYKTAYCDPGINGAGSYIIRAEAKYQNGFVATYEIPYEWVNPIEADLPSGQYIGTSVTFRCNDPNAESVRFSYGIDGQKIVFQNYSSELSATCNPSNTDDGDYTIYADVKDSTGIITTYKMNYKWIAAITTDLPNNQLVGTSVKFTCEVTEAPQIQFVQEFNGVQTILKDYSASRSVYCNPSSTGAGTYTIYANIKDNNNQVSTYATKFIWKEPITTDLDNGQMIGVSVKFTCNDPNAVQVRFRRELDGVDNIIQDYSSTKSFYCNPKATGAGTYTIYADVKDNNGNEQSYSVKFTWIEPITADLKSGQIIGTSVKFVCNDPNAVQVRFRREFNGEQKIFKDYNATNFAYCDPRGTGSGIYKILADVKDKNGNITTYSTKYTWLDAISTDLPTGQLTGTSVQFTCNVLDAVEIRFSREINGEKTVIREYAASRSVYSNPGTGNYVFYADVKDSTGKVTTYSVAYSWLDPISSDVPSGQVIGKKVKFTCNDLELEEVQFSIEYGNEKHIIQEYSDQNYVWCESTDFEAGTYKIYADVKNSAGDVTTYESRFIWLAPIVSDITYEPLIGTSVKFTCNDQDAVQVQFRREMNGEEKIFKYYNATKYAYCDPWYTGAGTYTIYADVRDSLGHVTTYSIEYTWHDPIEADLSSGQPAGTSVKFTCNVPNAVKIRFTREINGVKTVFRDYSSTKSAYCNPGQNGAGDYIIYADVEDGEGNIKTYQMEFTWIKQ